ncbi:SPOR domain-containing protein [Galbibacter orientalis]|uniref:SPOR domain-containing protein n=1 Tax=Galbibacter orientalis TaxID=453852 RepID=UPI003080C84C
MPYIDENHLVNLHKTIESKEITEARLLEELRKNRAEKERLYRTKNMFKWSSISLGLLLLFGVVLYIAKPSLYVSDEFLQSENKLLINESELSEYQQQISSLETTLNNLPSPSALDTLDYRDLNSEVIYAVQVAALENKDLSLYSKELRNISQYKDKDFNKYSLGNFTSLEDAKIFRKELIALGFQDAFVASYQNGKRLKIEEAL